MHQSPQSATPQFASNTAVTLFRQASAAGRGMLDSTELLTLLSALGIAFAPAAPA